MRNLAGQLLGHSEQKTYGPCATASTSASSYCRKSARTVTAEQKSRLEEEIESWEGFHWTLRKDDRELWEKMTQEVTERFAEATEKSDKRFTVDPFFMSLIVAQQRTIKSLVSEFRVRSVEAHQGETAPRVDEAVADPTPFTDK